MNLRRLIERDMERLAAHRLELVCRDERCFHEVWRLVPPDGGETWSTTLVFTVRGVCIGGDYRPENKWTTTTHGGKGIFLGHTEPGTAYLAEKFLTKVWDCEAAALWLEALASDWEMEATDGIVGLVRPDDHWSELAEMLEAARDGELTPDTLYEWLGDVDPDTREDAPGYKYDDGALARLVVIGRQFHRLYKARFCYDALTTEARLLDGLNRALEARGGRCAPPGRSCGDGDLIPL